jgi:hypothetical protein
LAKRTVVAAAAVVATVPLLAVGGAAVARADTRPGFSAAVEAEDGIPSYYLRKVPCGECSGGARMTGLGGQEDGSLLFYIVIPEDGDYTVTVYYSTDRPRDLAVNDKRLRHLDSGGLNRVAKAPVVVHLEQHFHRPAAINLGLGSGAPAADVDRIVVSRK